MFTFVVTSIKGYFSIYHFQSVYLELNPPEITMFEHNKLISRFICQNLLDKYINIINKLNKISFRASGMICSLTRIRFCRRCPGVLKINGRILDSCLQTKFAFRQWRKSSRRSEKQRRLHDDYSRLEMPEDISVNKPITNTPSLLIHYKIH